MPRHYSLQFRQRALSLVVRDRSVRQVASEFMFILMLEQHESALIPIDTYRGLPCRIVIYE